MRSFYCGLSVDFMRFIYLRVAAPYKYCKRSAVVKDKRSVDRHYDYSKQETRKNSEVTIQEE
jgi:hypothetical protein